MPQAKEREYLAIKDPNIGSDILLDLCEFFVFVEITLRQIAWSPILLASMT